MEVGIAMGAPESTEAADALASAASVAGLLGLRSRHGRTRGSGLGPPRCRPGIGSGAGRGRTFADDVLHRLPDYHSSRAQASARRRSGLAQLALQDLARRPLRQRVAELDQARVLVGGEALAAPGDHPLGAEPRAGPADYDGLHLLAVARVGHTDHRRLEDLRVRVEHLLDLTRVDVEAAADHHVL